MKLFIGNVLSFLLIGMILPCLFIFGSNLAINKGSFFQLPKDKYYVVLGHSHPQCAINDSLVDNCINLASSGESYLYTYVKAKKIIETNPQIKAFFVEYTNNQIMGNMNDWLYSSEYISAKYQQYAPIMDYDIHKILFLKNPNAVLKSQIKTVKNNFSFIAQSSFSSKDNYFIDNHLGGYNYLIRFKTDSLIKVEGGNFDKANAQKVSFDNIYYLQQIVKLCKSKNIKIFFIRCPMNKAIKTSYNEYNYKKILKTNFPEVILLDFKDFVVDNDDCGDLMHLNYKGARKFSKKFNQVIKTLYL